jgi:predicted nucleic acid-binding protein
MGSQAELILIDTNIFVIDMRYKRDVHYKKTQTFLYAIAQTDTGFTTIVNLLEICGILCFNLNQKQLFNLWIYFQERYKVSVLPPPDMQSNFPTLEIGKLFDILCRKMSFGDAMVLAVAEKYIPFAKTMVTWDKEHFENKYSGKVLTPEEYVTTFA